MPPLHDASVTMPDGRRLAYTEWGNPNGKPVLYFHGTPGSRTWCPDEEAVTSADVRLVLPDRPGIGGSEPKEGRTYADWPSDVVSLADALGIGRFAVVGVSAGGPYAAACAALIPGRISGVGIVSSRPLSKYDWGERAGIQDEWSEDDRRYFELAQSDPAAAADVAARDYAEDARRLDEDPGRIHTPLEAAEGDRWFFEDAARTAIFDAHIRESLRQGVSAMKWELVDAFQPWGFRLADISIPVHVWHGDQDPWVTRAHIEFQARTIPNCSVVIWSDSGHLGIAKHFREILETVTSAGANPQASAGASVT